MCKQILETRYLVSYNEIIISHLTAGDAELVHQFQFAPELGAGDFARNRRRYFEMVSVTCSAFH